MEGRSKCDVSEYLDVLGALLLRASLRSMVALLDGQMARHRSTVHPQGAGLVPGRTGQLTSGRASRP